tara:strand:- start:140 stop:376 length:237 start_codon:yes stop_codon:yes gene_type:complete
MKDKFGAYAQKLMTTILDTEQDEFVRELSWHELSRIKDSLTEFLIEHSKDDSEKKKNTEKVLLQEAKKNGNVQKEKIK